MTRKEYDNLMEEAIDAFPGTPEEFGEILFLATRKVDPPSWNEADRLRWMKQRDETTTAQKKLRSPPNGNVIYWTEWNFLRK